MIEIESFPSLIVAVTVSSPPVLPGVNVAVYIPPELSVKSPTVASERLAEAETVMPSSALPSGSTAVTVTVAVSLPPAFSSVASIEIVLLELGGPK